MGSPNLPMDLQEEILSWLPVKHVLQLRTVNKSWSELTRTSYFIALHHRHSTTRPNLLLTSLRQDNLKRIILTAANGGAAASATLTLRNSLEYHRNFKSLQCCNGLISMHPQNPENGETLVFNPSTRETLTLPFNVDKFKDFVCVCNFIGFEPIAREYKLMLIGSWPKHGNGRYAEIITLGTETWRKVNIEGTPAILDGSGTNFSFNGALHWLSFDYEKIVVFDLKNEEFRTISVPEQIRKRWITYKMCRVKGCLTLAEFGVFQEESAVKLWMLRDYENNVWVKETIVVSTPKATGHCVDLVGSVSDDEVLITTKSPEPDMFCHDLKAKTWREIGVRGMPKTRLEDQCTMIYRESMMSVQGNKMIVNR